MWRRHDGGDGAVDIHVVEEPEWADGDSDALLRKDR